MEVKTMYDYENLYNTPSEDELMHYGVIGMKWGVRRARKTLSSSNSTKEAKTKAKSSLDKHYEKASNKLTKISAKADTHLEKARKHAVKAETKWSESGRAKQKEKASKSRRKALKKMKKASDWLNTMDETFRDTSIKPTKEQRAIGRRYIDTLNTRVMSANY